MSASTWNGRPKRRAVAEDASAETPAPEMRSWIGVDVAHIGTSRPSRAVLPLLVMALVVALGVASLRIDLIRTRYALAEATAEEKRLIAEQHALIVLKRQLRDPVVLAKVARERGFRPAEALRTLADPMPMAIARLPIPSAPRLPPVAAGPSTTATPATPLASGDLPGERPR